MLFMVVFTEVLLVVSATMCIILYIMFLISICIILSKKENLNQFDKLLSILLVVPLIKILQIFIIISFPWKYLLGYATLLIVSIYYIWLFKIKIKTKENYLTIPLVAIIGILVGFLGKIFSIGTMEFSILLVCMMVFSEELFFRGLIQKTSAPVIGIPFSIIMPALFYGLLHSSLGIFPFVYFLAFGLISGIIYWSTENIILCFFLGLVANFILFLTF